MTSVSVLETALQTATMAFNLSQKENLILKNKYLKRKVELEVLLAKLSEKESMIQSLQNSNESDLNSRKKKRITKTEQDCKNRRIKCTETEIHAIEEGINLFGRRKCSDIKKNFFDELSNRSSQQIRDWIRNDTKRKESII